MEIEESQPHPVHTLSLNLLVKGAQNSHGLKRGDYQQYRLYCANKVRKMRKQMKFSLAIKDKFVNRKVEQERTEDPRSLQVLLFNAEKNWAHANEVKDMSKNRKISKGNKNRQTILKKFKKALSWAQRLEEVCVAHADKKATFEAETYRLFLEGMVSFETQEFAVASQSFIKCREILSQLEKVSDSVTASILKEKIEQVEASIRYCTFRESKGKQLTINEILDMKRINDPTLTAKLENLTQTEGVIDELTVRLGKETFSVKNPVISTQSQRIELLDREVEELLKREQKDDSSQENLLSAFGDLFVSYDQLIRVLDKEKENAQYTQAQKQNLSRLSLGFHENKFHRMLQRLEKIFTFSSAVKKLPPQTLAKLLTNIMSILSQSNDLEKDKSKLNNKAVDMEVIRKTDDLAFYYRTLRLHLVSQVYYNNNKVTEAYSLWIEAERCLEIIKSKELTTNLLVSVEELEKCIKTGKLTCWIQLTQKQTHQQHEVTKGIESITLKDTKEIKEHSLQYLRNHPSQLSRLNLEEICELEAVKLPPGLQLLPSRPIFFDVMHQHIGYPSLEKRLEKEKEKEKGGFWNRFNIFK